MMGMLLEFAQWKPSRRNRQDTPPRSRQLYETIIDMISLYKYGCPHSVRITSADAMRLTSRRRRAVESPTQTTSRQNQTSSASRSPTTSAARGRVAAGSTCTSGRRVCAGRDCAGWGDSWTKTTASDNLILVLPLHYYSR
jgi:hypothetical protein